MGGSCKWLKSQGGGLQEILVAVVTRRARGGGRTYTPHSAVCDGLLQRLKHSEHVAD